EQQERAFVRAFHHHLALRLCDSDGAEPATPVRRFAGRTLQAAGNGVALTKFREARIEGFVDDASIRHGRQYRHQRRVGYRAFAGIFRPGRNQKGTTLFYIFSNVVVIENGQHIAVLVAIEDDKVELVDLLHEQFPCREGDQRQFVDRRSVLLFRRTQNGEVHEVYRGVRFQQIAPASLTRMRLPGHKQDSQILTYAVDQGHCLVVGFGKLALHRRNGEFDDVATGIGDRDLKRHFLPDEGPVDRDLAPVHRHLHLDRAGRAIGGDDAIGQFKRFAGQAKAWGLLEADAPVNLVFLAGNESVQRRVEFRYAGGHIVDLAVSNHHRATDARRRHISKSAVESGKQPRFCSLLGGLRLPCLDHPHVELREAGKTLLDALQRRFGLFSPIADVLALAAVDDDGNDAFQRMAKLVKKNGVEQGKRQCRNGCESQPCTALAEPQGRSGKQRQRGDCNGNQLP